MATTLAQRTSEFITQAMVAEKKWRDEQARLVKEWDEKEAYKKAHVLPCLRLAKAREFKRWLKGYMLKGNDPTRYYPYKMPANFYVANSSFKLGDFCGSGKIHIIVPKGFDFLGVPIGHCNIYFMDGFTVKGGWIPMYSDTIPR